MPIRTIPERRSGLSFEDWEPDPADSAITLDEIPDRKPRTEWGKWRLENAYLCINYPESNASYDIPVESLRESAFQCLDWIFQLGQKIWLTDEDRADMLRAIQELVRPQARFQPGPMKLKVTRIK